MLNYWNNYDQPLLNCFYSITSPTRSLQVIPVIQQRPQRCTRMIRTAGRRPVSRANGSFPKGARRLSEKSPAKHPPRRRRDGIAWERGRPARILSLWPPLSFSAMLQAATLWAGTAAAKPKESHGAVPVGAGGTPALPGSHHPMTSSRQGHKIAEASWCRLWLKEVHLSSCLFVFIRVHSWFVFINDRPFSLE